MQISLSKRIQSIAVSATIAMNQKTQELKANGVDVINLTVGEPDFFTPEDIKQAAKEAIDQNYSFYSAVEGYPELRQAVCKKFLRDNALNYQPNQILISNGAKHCLANALQCLIDEGDEVIIPSPYWVSYADMVKLANGSPIILETEKESGYKLTAAQLEAAITPATKMLLLCSPCNPTGAVYSYDELHALAKVIEKYPKLWVMTDEIYEHINYVGAHHSMAEFASIAERVIVVNGVSKGYAMTGYRIGFMAAHADLIKACGKLQGQFTTNPCSISQRAALYALNGTTEVCKQMNEAYLRRRRLVIDALRQIPGIVPNEPEGAFYVFPDITDYFGKTDGSRVIRNDQDFCLYLLEKAFVSTVPGSAFGDGRCIRISFSSKDEVLAEAMERMKKALSLLS